MQLMSMDVNMIEFDVLLHQDVELPVTNTHYIIIINETIPFSNIQSPNCEQEK